MQELAPFKAGPPPSEQIRRNIRVVEIRDPKTRQSLIIEHDQDLSGWNIDTEEAGWDHGEPHTDGLLVGHLDDEVVVCFVELTGSLSDELASNKKETIAQRKLRQLEGAARHFHPTGRGTPSASHGALHHDAFAAGRDDLDPRPSANHRVVGVVVANRQGSRAPTPPAKLGPTTMPRQFRVIPARTRQVARISFRDLIAP